MEVRRAASSVVNGGMRHCASFTKRGQTSPAWPLLMLVLTPVSYDSLDVGLVWAVASSARATGPAPDGGVGGAAVRGPFPAGLRPLVTGATGRRPPDTLLSSGSRFVIPCSPSARQRCRPGQRVHDRSAQAGAPKAAQGACPRCPSVGSPPSSVAATWSCSILLAGFARRRRSLGWCDELHGTHVVTSDPHALRTGDHATKRPIRVHRVSVFHEEVVGMRVGRRE